MNYLKDNTLTQEQLRNRKKRKTLLLWQGEERQKVDRFVLVKAQTPVSNCTQSTNKKA